MKNPKPITMKFICNQDWGSMTITEKGRFCGNCNKEVHDLRHKSNRAIHTLKEEYQEICGIMNAEQVETHLHPIELRYFKRSRYWLATIGTFLGLQMGSLKAQEKTMVRTEIHTGDSTDVKTGNICRVEERPIEAEDPELKEFKPARKSKYYWTWRWPFIVKKQERYVMGFF